MHSATRSSRRIGLPSPTGRSRNTRPKWLPSLLRVLERTQVDRHGRAQRHAVDVVAALDHVAAQRAGGGGHQHVVDGAVAGAADRLDLLQVERLGPGHALAHAQRAAQQRRRIVRQRQRMQQFARDLAAFLRQHRGQGRVAVHLHALLDDLAAELHVAVDGADAARDLGVRPA